MAKIYEHLWLYLIFMFDPEVYTDVKANDDKDEDDIAHEPDINLLEVAGLG